jgi:hypothetical protein
VLGDIRQRLLDHAVDARLKVRVEARPVGPGQLDLAADLQIVDRAMALQQRFERSLEP